MKNQRGKKNSVNQNNDEDDNKRGQRWGMERKKKTRAKEDTRHRIQFEGKQ